MRKDSNCSFAITDLKIGQVVEMQVLITEDDIDLFANISRDFSSIHMDREKAREAGFQDRVVHGALIASYFSAIVGVYLPGDTAILMQSENKFHNPAYPNTTLLISGKVTSIHLGLECVEISLKAFNEIQQRIASGKWLVKVRNI
jgi:3-hydroxybutyryl-CoA dehydratase